MIASIKNRSITKSITRRTQNLERLPEDPTPEEIFQRELQLLHLRNRESSNFALEVKQVGGRFVFEPVEIVCE